VFKTFPKTHILSLYNVALMEITFS